MAIPFVARKAAAVVAAHRIGAAGKDVAGPQLALVLVRHFAAFPAKTVVAVTLGLETDPVLTAFPCSLSTVL